MTTLRFYLRVAEGAVVVAACAVLYAVAGITCGRALHRSGA